MIEVVGLSARGWEDLPPRLRSLVGQADLLVGSRRLLGLIPVGTGPTASGGIQGRLSWPAPLREGLVELLSGRPGRVVALASGDPLLAGIGGTLVDLFGPDQVRVHPGVSAVALARARLGWAAETTTTIRLRGADLDQLRAALYAGARLVVLSRDAATPQEVAELLVAVGFGDSTMTVLGDLDGDAETRVDARAAEWAGPAPALNVVCIAARGTAEAASLAPGLPDAAYDHDGQLTKRDIRASALARLQPRPGELLWDVGAGAGSVSIEWMRADPSCRAVAIEQSVDRAKRIRQNAAALGVPGLQVLIGKAPGVLTGLATPAAVFVGGGASLDTIEHAWAALPSGGRIVAHAVTLETEALLVDCWRRRGGELTRILVEHLETIGQFHGWKPARAVVQWSVVKGSEMSTATAVGSASEEGSPGRLTGMGDTAGWPVGQHDAAGAPALAEPALAERPRAGPASLPSPRSGPAVGFAAEVSR